MPIRHKYMDIFVSRYISVVVLW